MDTITITFGDRAENHKGMEIIGTPAESGFSLEDLLYAKYYFGYHGLPSELYDLNKRNNFDAEPAYLLVIRQGLNYFCNPDQFYEEQVNLDHDKKMWNKGRVTNKNARWNLTFDYHSQEPDYENRRGRIVSYQEVPLLNHVRTKLSEVLGRPLDLKAEGNYYYNLNECGIGFHGDSERKQVIGVRLGKTMILRYRWYHWGEPVSGNLDVYLNHGDMYIMSSKAVGTDWYTKSKPTLRHAAGSYKFIQ